MFEKTILIADDDQVILEFYRKIFSSLASDDLVVLGALPPVQMHDLECETFDDPRRLLQRYEGLLAQGHHCPLCILDMRMPQMSGMDAAMQLRRMDPNIEVLICTAYSDMPIKEIREKLKANVYFVKKPFGNEEFFLLAHSLVFSWNYKRSLEQSEQRLHKALEGAGDACWDWNIQKGDVVYSSEWGPMLGYCPDELEPRFDTWEKLVHPDDLPTVLGALQAHLEGRTKHYSSEHRLRNKSGGWTWILARGKVVAWDETGKALRACGTHTNIMFQKQLEADLRQAKEAAESANRAKSEFLAMMSHEIRTPMNAIAGMTNLLLDTPLNEQQHEFATMTRRSSEVLMEIINDILDFSRIEAGQLRLEMENFELRSLVAGVLELLDSRAKEKGLVLSMDVATDLPKGLRSDDGRLRQVLVNLVGNSIKFTQHGEIVVRVRCLSQSGLQARLGFEIQDSGIGISAENQAQLFQPFTQVNTAIARKHGGTGLGLAISRRIVELLGGKIGVRSTPGIGSVFWFEIVAETVQIGAVASESPQEPPPFSADATKPLRILVAEDHDANRRLAQLMLEKLGYQADFVGNGREAVEAWERLGYDVILMDCQMPEMDGFEATCEIRRQEAARPAGMRSPVRIVALTANALIGDRERCLASGMDVYISKPVTLAALKTALSKASRTEARMPLINDPATLSKPESKVAELRNEFGADVVVELVNSFLKDTPPRLDELRKLTAEPDRKTLIRAAHSLAGSCGIFGLEEMRKLALNLENQAVFEDSQKCEIILAGLEQQFAVMRPQLEQLRNKTEKGMD